MCYKKYTILILCVLGVLNISGILLSLIFPEYGFESELVRVLGLILALLIVSLVMVSYTFELGFAVSLLSGIVVAVLSFSDFIAFVSGYNFTSMGYYGLLFAVISIVLVYTSLKADETLNIL